MSNKVKQSDFKSALRHIWRKSWIGILILAVVCAVPFAVWPRPAGLMNRVMALWPAMYKILFVTGLLALVVYVCNKLTDYCSLKKFEKGITWWQITILIAFVLWVFAFLLVFRIHKESRSFLVLGIIGTMLGWVFQDTIKGVAAFIHLRLNHLLEIDDWIAVPSRNVDGEVKRITLTTVTIYNWDTTTSSIPTSVLHSDHFINYQKMTTGKTYGRLMIKTFILDTGWFRPLSAEDIDRLQKEEQKDLRRYLRKDDIREGMLNAELYRLYLFHWLMDNNKVSQQPRLVVRWLEQKETGLPLQVYAFIMEGSMPAFEWQQSKIIEHIVESLDWFGLKLFQTPSSFDVSNSNIYLTQEEATYRKEIGK